MGKLIYTILLLAIAVISRGQELPGGLFDSDARAWIKANYYDGEHHALSYSDARKKMFAHIANVNDTIECVYSGLRQYLQEGDESVAYPAPFNTEHVVPQSLFNSDEPMRSDIFILQPCYEDWNSARSAYPFDEINDNQTDRWYYLDQSMSSIPTQNINKYSELLSGTSWEPRENKKGDVARAIMYFFTMYPGYDINSVIDTSELCNWHEQDMVDAFELQRNALTQVYQGNINPYIYRPHWANQAWGCSVTPPPNVAPVADDDEATMEMGSTIVVNVLNNDSDIDGSLDPLSVAVVSGPSNGNAVVNANGTIDYTSDPLFIGTDTFSYKVCDNAEPPACDTAEVVIIVGSLSVIGRELSVGLDLYPNPTAGLVHLELDASIRYPAFLSVVDVTGREIDSIRLVSDTIGFDINLPDGTYFLILRNKQGDLLGSAPIQVLK